jgi:hypothetical protein
MRSPMSVVFQVRGEMLGEENMPYIAATHDPLCHVNSGPSEIGLIVHICEWTPVVVTRASVLLFALAKRRVFGSADHF